MLGLVAESDIVLGYFIVAPIVVGSESDGNMSDVKLGMLVFRLEND
jgi:hypothetical protein